MTEQKPATKRAPARKTAPAPPAPALPNYLTEQQINWLMQPVEPQRVGRTEGRSNMMAYDIRNHLNEVFGFGRWSADTLAMELIYDHRDQTSAGKPAFNVAYRAQVQLKVHAPDGTLLATYTEGAGGEWNMPEAKPGDAHDAAMKTAESQALKRCAINLGNQYGLSLYAKGYMGSITRGTFVHPVAPAQELEPITEQRPEDIDPDTGLPERDVNQEPAAQPQAPVSDRTPQTVQPPTPPAGSAQQPPAQPAQNVIYEGTQPVPLDVDIPALAHEFEETVMTALTPEARTELGKLWKQTGLPNTQAFRTKQQVDKAWELYERVKPAPMAQPGTDAAAHQLDQVRQHQQQAQQDQARRAFYGNGPEPDHTEYPDPDYP